ncbi:autotransporter secretion inner membrane protein TamB [Nitrosomonas sp. Nm84]|uniref:translocation/assembly module TamB domain-containing protein n=1 Tax=Nitrosomonas sp. Nm84 TaxID=200124 RepID=UPI000D766D60|nr:translocation/assembly module TamB domain-containing protein [Nitrosomonas sp. Nm84]PXW83491.1 autotransporter secretion inner membrane protein TamB [Nitrosomonas sp. Nm84]
MTNPSHSNHSSQNSHKPYNRLVSLLLVLILLASSAGYWLFSTSSGLQWTFSTINRLSAGAVQFEEIQGTLQNMRIANIRMVSDEYQVSLQNVHVSWRPGQLLRKWIEIDQITIEAVDIQQLLATTATPPPTLPEHLTIPLAVSIHLLKVNTIQVISAENQHSALTLSNLALSLASNGYDHRLNHLDFHTHWGAVSALAALNGNAPFELSGRIDLADADPWGDTEAVITGNLEQLNIQINAKQSNIKRDLKLHLQPFAANPVTQFHANLERLNPAGFLSDAPTADLSVSAHLTQNESGQLAGEVQIENLTATPLNHSGLPFTKISTQVLMTENVIQLQNIRTRIAANEVIRGSLIWHRQEASASADFLVNQLNPQHIDSRIQITQVSGQINLQGNAQKQSARINLKDNSAVLNAAITRTDNHITLEQFNLQRNKSRLSGQGKLDLSNEQSFELSSNLVNFNIANFVQAPDSNLNATIKLAGKLSPHISGVLEYAIQKSHLAKSPITGSGQVAFSGREQFKGKAELTVGSNHFLAQGDMRESDNTLQLEINAPSLQQLGLGLTGDLQARLKFNGNLNSPDFQVNIHSKRLHMPEEQHLSGLSVNGRLHNDTISFNATVANYATNQKTVLQHLAVDTHGKVSDHTVSVNAQINDDIQIRMKATGAMEGKTPLQSLRWNGQLAELSSVGEIPIRLKTPATLSINPDSITLGHATFSISDGFLSIDQLQWTPKEWKTSGHFSGVAVYPGKQHTVRESALHVGGQWDFASSVQLKGNLQIRREHGDWYLPGDISQPIGLETLQLQVTAHDETITGKFELVSQQLGNAKAHLTVPIKQSTNRWSIAGEAPLHGEVTAHISNLKWVDAILDNSISMNGQLQIQAHIKGTLNQPDFTGAATGKALSILLLEHGIDLQQGDLVASFHHSNLNIDRLDFITPHRPPPDNRLLKDLKLDDTSGTLKITGNIGLVGNESHLNFKMSQLPLAHKTDYWIITSGSGQAKFHNNNLSVKGDILADAGILLQPPDNRPELSEDIVFVNSRPSTTQQNLSLLLDMNLNLGEKFFIHVSGLEGRLAGQLQIQSDQKNALKVSGSISAQDTTFKAYGQDLTVKRGIVSFQGPLDDPGLSVLAIREGLQVEAGVEILGSVRHPQVKLVSTPNVPDTEKLSWIVLGRKPDASGLDTSALLLAAGSILGGQSGTGITDQITRTLGVDEITVKQAGIGSSLTGQVGVIGKRISSRVYLSYERSLATTTMGITKLTYNLTPRVTVVTQAGEDNAASLFYTIQFD